MECGGGTPVRVTHGGNRGRKGKEWIALENTPGTEKVWR